MVVKIRTDVEHISPDNASTSENGSQQVENIESIGIYRAFREEWKLVHSPNEGKRCGCVVSSMPDIDRERQHFSS
ncbi:hypothetical protein Y032_0103g3513 [Ancylostoma ceylanicum]|uniref:Uncharacterized protein n=1 Tax=Ancylostoma ceylanicum TaxID=53326 RepID=A0A016TFU9_9BILA|nr:hypothetical protein Y032_0103g3513 [Ancylostoma ceylanicum]